MTPCKISGKSTQGYLLSGLSTMRILWLPEKKSLSGEMTSWSVSKNTPWGTVSRPGTGTSPMLLNLINVYRFKAAFLNCCHGNEWPVQPDIVSVNQHCVIGVFSQLRFDLASFSSQNRGIVFTDYYQILLKKMRCNFLLRISAKGSHPFLHWWWPWPCSVTEKYDDLNAWHAGCFQVKSDIPNLYS